MKKIKHLIVLLLLPIFLCGCISVGNKFAKPLSFYYLSRTIHYGTENGYIGYEQRECVTCNNISDIIALYMTGPVSEDLYTAFPSGVRVIFIEETEETITLTLSDQVNKADRLSINIACACLAYTLFGATEVQTVIIQAEHGFDSFDGYLTYSRDGILLDDQPMLTNPE